MSNKTNVQELIDRIEEEEDNNFAVAENKRAVEADLVKSQEEVVALQGSIQKVNNQTNDNH